MRLIINGYDMDMPEKNGIRYTLQANTIANLTTRQSNFTPSFNLPKSDINIQAMQNLSLVGNASNIPYERNEAFLYDDSGESIIENGWAVIKETTKSFKCYIYDGNIDFYKAIENKSLTDVGLVELNHLKNISNVIGTWSNLDLPYRYNIADYNGNNIYELVKLNIDYQIPSANVKYLWDKIFEHIGWTYTGSSFNLEAFKNLWLTYPKTISSETQVTTLIKSFNWTDNIVYGDVLNITEHNSLIACINCSHLNNEYAVGSQNNIDILGSSVTMNNSKITVLQDGLYKFTISGTVANTNGTATAIFLSLGEGSEYITETIATVNYGESFDIVYYKNLSAGESFGVIFDFLTFNGNNGNVDIDFELVEGNTVDFEEAFIDFSITDFVREILVRLGLTPFTDIRNKNVEFLTLDEIILNEDVDDWTDKFQQKSSESYTYENYARRNTFKYKYDDKDANYNDGYINVDNINLRDQTTAFQSKIYSPEKNKTGILNRLYNVYKFWNKEVKDDGTIKYKALENRFYFMKSKVIQSNITVGSDEFQSDQITNVFAVEDYTQMNWVSVLNEFYPAINSILNRSKIFKTLINLNVIDIKKMDFKKPVFIAQEASYFLKNKISSWKPNESKTSTELIKLDLSVVQDAIVILNPQILINSSITDPNPPFSFTHLIFTQFSFLDYTPTGATITMKRLDASPEDGGVPTGFVYSGSVNINSNSFAQTLPITEPFNFGWYQVQIIDADGLESNIEYVYFGNSGTGNTNPSIEVLPEIIGATIYVEHTRDVNYKFNNFTPASGVLTVQAYNFVIGAYGSITTVALSNLSADTLHTSIDVVFPEANGYYEIKLVTDTISFSQTYLVL